MSTILFLFFRDNIVSKRSSDYASSTSSGKSRETLYRSNCIVLQDAPDSASRSNANASRYSTEVRTYTRISSRNSAVHFYYLSFYGRKSLPHADSRCVEGRRATAVGELGKNEPRTAPSYPSDGEAGDGARMYVRTYGLLIRLYPERIQFPR